MTLSKFLEGVQRHQNPSARPERTALNAQNRLRLEATGTSYQTPFHSQNLKNRTNLEDWKVALDLTHPKIEDPEKVYEIRAKRIIDYAKRHAEEMGRQNVGISIIAHPELFPHIILTMTTNLERDSMRSLPVRATIRNWAT
ncbi:hypothetical protein HY572_04625 [Candidatus Micrarchaeota archaeon]|nr:hypothetical protein [Candidatus Micrarchaeota archaeon]